MTDKIYYPRCPYCGQEMNYGINIETHKIMCPMKEKWYSRLMASQQHRLLKRSKNRGLSTTKSEK